MSSLEFFLKILRSDSRADTAIRIPTNSQGVLSPGPNLVSICCNFYLS